MPPKIFISYNHADEEWKDKLQKFLNVQIRLNRLIVWEDRQIKTGDEWNPTIKKAIVESEIAILLVSVNFLNSDFIQNQEIPFIQDNNLKIMPIIISPCPWEEFEYISKQQGFTKNNQPLEELNVNIELNRIANELCRFNLVNRVAKKESIDLKKLLKNYLQNITPLKEAMLTYIPSYSLHYENILDAFSFESLFEILEQEFANGYLYCVLKVLDIKEVDLKKFDTNRRCEKNRIDINRIILLVEPNSDNNISASNVDIWCVWGTEYRLFDNLKSVNFKDKSDYERKLSEKLVEIQNIGFSQSIEIQLILPNKLLESKYNFQKIKIKLDPSFKSQKLSKYFNITTKFLQRYNALNSIKNEEKKQEPRYIQWWREKSTSHRKSNSKKIKSLVYCCDDTNIADPFNYFIHRGKEFLFSDTTLLKKNSLHEIFMLGTPFVLCPQKGTMDISAINLENSSPQNIKKEVFLLFNRKGKTIHYIHDDFYDTQQLISAKNGTDDNFLI